MSQTWRDILNRLAANDAQVQIIGELAKRVTELERRMRAMEERN
jgi:hypothetical protein